MDDHDYPIMVFSNLWVIELIVKEKHVLTSSMFLLYMSLAPATAVKLLASAVACQMGKDTEMIQDSFDDKRK